MIGPDIRGAVTLALSALFGSARPDPWRDALNAIARDPSRENIASVLRVLLDDTIERAALVMIGDDDVELVDLGAGDDDSIEIDAQEVLDLIDESDCHSATVAHTHGKVRDARPSDEDRVAWRELREEMRFRDISYSEIVVARTHARDVGTRHRIGWSRRRRRR
jgi:hypothetical protein